MVHVNLIVQGLSGGKDPKPVLDKFVSMLSKSCCHSVSLFGINLTRSIELGGYLQWAEYEYSPDAIMSVTVDRSRFPNPEVSFPVSKEFAVVVIKEFGWPTDFFGTLLAQFEVVGLEDIVMEQKPIRPSVARAFYEYWITFCA